MVDKISSTKQIALDRIYRRGIEAAEETLAVAAQLEINKENLDPESLALIDAALDQ